MTVQPLFLFDGASPDGQEVWTIELPLPPKGTGSNARGSWLWNKDAIREYRAECARRLTEAQLPPFRMPVVIHLAFYYHRGKPATNPENFKWRPRLKKWDFRYQVCYDEGNAREGAKPAIDALQEAGIVPRDSRRNVRQGFCTLYGAQKEHRGKTGLVMIIQAERA
jgi:hypothetical protein